MADVLTDVSLASMAHAVEANLFAFFPLLAKWPRAEAHDDPDMIWTLSDAPFPLFNSVLRARIESGDVDAAISRVVTRCRRRHLPMLWWTGPATLPRDLESRLNAEGFYEDHATGMAIDLDLPVDYRSTVPQLRVEPVIDAADLETWCAVLCDGFGAPQAFGHAFADFASTVGLSSPSPLRHYLATIEGVPVATSTLFFGAGAAGIYDVATLPPWRRKGVGAAITAATMEAARSHGCRISILHSSSLGAGMYRSLGFQDCCRIGQYVWAP